MYENEVRRLTALFDSQVGTREQGENNVIYNTDYYGGPVSGPSYPWCCAFVWDMFRIAGMSALFCGGQKTAWCPYVVGYAKSSGQWVTEGYRAGDVILYDFDGDRQADHIGFCTEAGPTALVAIEGNVAGEVRRMTRSVLGVLGAYRPRYAAEPPQDGSVPADGSGGSEEPSDASGGAALPGGTYIVQPYDSLWKIARDQLGDENRWHEIYELNGLTSSTIHPGDVLRLPGPPGEDPGQELDLPFAVPMVSVDLPQLRRGIQGRDVAALQILLQRAGYALPLYGADGDFGEETEAALKLFQADMSLEATGSADARTWFALIC